MATPTRTALLVGGAAVVLVSLLLEIVVPAEHGPGWRDVWFHRVPGFHAALGLVGAGLVVAVSRALGKAFLQRPEDYYGEADPDADDPAPGPQGHRRE